MKTTRTVARPAALIAALLLLLLLFQPVHASSLTGSGREHPPIFTVLALGAPKDMSVTIQIHKKDEVIPIPLSSRRQLWERQYFLFRESTIRITAWYGNPVDLKDAELVFESGDETRILPVTDDMLHGTGQHSEDYVTYRWNSNTLTSGLPWWRTPIAYALWIAVSWIVEGVVLFLYGYRKAKSWIYLILINLVTTGLHHATIAGLFVPSDRIRIYLFAVPLLLLVEILISLPVLKERTPDKAISCTLVGNVLSQIVLALLIGRMPG